MKTVSLKILLYQVIYKVIRISNKNLTNKGMPPMNISKKFKKKGFPVKNALSFDLNKNKTIKLNKMHPYSYSKQKPTVGILHSCVNFSYLGYAKLKYVKKKRK